MFIRSIAIFVKKKKKTHIIIDGKCQKTTID